MVAAAATDVPTDDIALRVDPESKGGGSAREIDGSEGAFPEQEAMADRADKVKADDIALRVDTAGKSGGCAREIDRRVGAVVQQETMVMAARHVIADNIALWVDTEGKSERGAWGVDGGEGKRGGLVVGRSEPSGCAKGDEAHG